jgi:hypothetical protein
MENRPDGKSITEILPGLDTMRVADAQTGRPYSKSLNRLTPVEGWKGVWKDSFHP